MQVKTIIEIRLTIIKIMKGANYFKSDSSKLETQSFKLDVASFTSNEKVADHSHENAFFCMALRGVCSENYNRKERVYEPSVLSYLPAGHSHSLKFYESGMRSFSIEIKPSLVERMREFSLDIKDSIHCRGGQLTFLFKKAYGEFCQMDDVSLLSVEGIVLEMLAEVSRRQITKESKQSPRWLKAANDLMRERFSENLSLDEISKTVGVHPVYLARIFRQYYRCSVGEFMRQLRIEYASRQLLLTKATLLEISTSAGFSDQSHFSRIFKRYTGVTPGGFRAIHSKG